MELFYQSTSKNPVHALEYYAYSVGSYHYNWHNQVELMVVLQGELELNANGRIHNLREDDIIWINPREGHTSFAHTLSTIAFVLHFNMQMLTSLANLPDHVQVDFVSAGDAGGVSQAVRRQIAALMQAADRTGLDRELMILASVYEILHLIAGDKARLIEHPVNRFKGKTEDPIRNMVLYIEKHYRESITLEDLGRVGGYNTNYVSQLFRKHMGLTFYEYVTRVRLRQALVDLRDTELSVLEVADRNGFADVRGFNRAFKASFSKTPLAYRNSLSSQHKEIDRVFKRTFIPKDAPVILNKIAQYSRAGLEDEAAQKAAVDARRLQALELFEASVRQGLETLGIP